MGLTMGTQEIRSRLRQSRRKSDIVAQTELREFLSLLDSSDVYDHASELLPDLLIEADRLDLDRAGLAKGVPTTEATISRWANAKNLTHIAIARSAIRVLADLADVRLARLAKKRTG
jgi:hypothetical protein